MFARYYGSQVARFLSPDQLLADTHVGNPQSWNHYTYAANNPIRLVDRQGMQAEDPVNSASYAYESLVGYGFNLGDKKAMMLENHGLLDVNHPDVEESLLSQALVRFYWLRELSDLRKRPSTSELVDWIAALRRAGFSAEKIETELPFLGVLLKHEKDLETVRRGGGRSRWR